MTRNERIRRCLAEEPCTSNEISFILNLTPRSARVGLWVLRHCQNEVKIIGRIPGEGKGNPARKIYDLTARGRSKVLANGGAL